MAVVASPLRGYHHRKGWLRPRVGWGNRRLARSADFLFGALVGATCWRNNPMDSLTKVVGVTAAGLAAATGVVVARARRLSNPDSRKQGEEDGAARWRSVTINRSREEVAPDGRLPLPLEALGDLVEVRITDAAGGRGTELAARLRGPEPTGGAALARQAAGKDPRQQVRVALREAKQLVEVGEILQLEPVPHGDRSATPTGALVHFATRRAGGEGLL